LKLKSIWDKKCYETVTWDKIENEVSPHYIHYLGDTTIAMEKKTEPKGKTAIIGAFLETINTISPLFGILIAAITGGKVSNNSKNEFERRQIEEVYNEVLPIRRRSFIGTGEREPWMDSDEKLSPYDKDSTTHIIEGIANGFSLSNAQPKEINGKKRMEFQHNLYLAGGPISNAYSRNVLYGKTIQTPYKFRLDLNEKLVDFSPSKLKKISYKTEPNWYICDENGHEIKNGTPKIKNGKIIEDSFMIIKCNNIYPQANKNTKCVIFAGCHGLGTAAAGKIIKNQQVIDYIYSKVESNDFQLLGKVSIEPKLYEYGISEEIGNLSKDNIIDIQQL